MDINNESRRYIIQSVILLCLLTMLGGLAMSLWSLDLLSALVLSGCFILAIDLATGLIFRWVATRHADMLSSFFTGVSGFRFLGALAVISLIHHSIFFSRISNRL